ncbi:MAG TPA: malto-oligosyltrehalose synthase [Thermoleophilaceae bacterium]|nr:malto-oligosyltrehalose synthase [Thermoleophilaceae bacterium]
MTDFRATYRLMFGAGFGFREARELVPYLAELGVSHLYLPPSFQARKGSTHGYDVIDPTSISQEFGGEDEFRALAAEAHAHGLGIVLDIVPNHMAVDDANRYWADEALRTKFFDIDPATGRHRRFFDIDHLAGVRQEDPEVFAETHRLALSLVHEGVVDGLRVDHPDGLADPAGYLSRLRAGGVEHVWVEKILDPGERLRADWPVEGTVGYEFLNDLAALFVDRSGESALDALWIERSGDGRQFGDYAFEAKLEQASGVFKPDVERLAREAPGVEGLEEALSSLPVYRTYVDAVAGKVSAEDREAIAEARIPDPLASMLLLDAPAPPAFVTRFQQTSPAVMAKGVEDTAFYRYARLLALNEVGGDPSRFGISVQRFHEANAERLAAHPLNLLITQTHDTKRSGDVRARIGALAGMPEEWAAHVRRWFEVNEPLRSGGAPDPAEEYFIYQNLVGAWPIEPERLEAYVEKALREAKRNTNWADPDHDWEERVKAFCRGLYDHRPFRDSFDGFAAVVADVGERSALAQLLLKLTAPGVPDIYQGDELVSLSLVDPDNRRPVDWERRREALAAVRADPTAEPAALASGASAGGAGSAGGRSAADIRKLQLVTSALDLRKRRPDAFAGGYEPIEAGEKAIAYLRGGEVLVAAEIHPGGADTVIGGPGGAWHRVAGGPHNGPGGAWHRVAGGPHNEIELSGRIRLADLLDEQGIALLERA